MKKIILGLLLLFSVNVMAIHVPHFHHYSRPHHRTHVTTKARNVQSHKIRPMARQHNTKVANTFWRNGILYYIILNPRRSHVYDNGKVQEHIFILKQDSFVLCNGCNKVLVKKGVKYCNKCRRIKETKTDKVMKDNFKRNEPVYKSIF